MSKQGKIIIRKSKKGKWIFEVEIGKKQPMKIPDFYDLKEDLLNEKECEVERDKKGRISKITIDGKELPKKQFSSKTSHGEFDKEHHKDIYNRGRNVQKADIKDSLDVQKTELPEDTKNILTGIKDIDNFALKLNKVARLEGDKFKFFKTDNKGNVIYQIKANFSESMIKDISKRYYESIQKLHLKLSDKLILKPDWRLIVGLGNESVYETSMTLHHIYGIPYIPASAVKGVTRHWKILKLFEESKVSDFKEINCLMKFLESANDINLPYEKFKEKFKSKNTEPSKKLYAFLKSKKDECKTFQDIFGTQNKIGKVIFFNAYPTETPKIEPDVMNVHYPDYYGGNKPPTDYQNPKPIFFLTVKETPFRFIIGIKSKDNTPIQGGTYKGKIPIDVTFNNIKEALSEHGIGAKTSVGYGYFDI